MACGGGCEGGVRRILMFCSGFFGFGELLKECLNTRITDYIFNESRN